MCNAAKIAAILVAGIGLLHTCESPAHAALSALPKSHVVALPDGQHMIVFLSPVPIAEDEGRTAQLPDGRTVDLREHFPASGCYEIGSHQPIWTAPWDSSDVWRVSADGRYLVCWNIFGDGAYARGGQLDWGIKFYDRGTEIKSYDVAELLDYPALMPFTTGDWHDLWYDDEGDNAVLEGKLFDFRTSTHDRYRFDITTGEIIEEHHMGRYVFPLMIAG
ncbi:MAG: hypothetical protein U0805_18620 [Pirellulales bacterium]